VLALRVRRAAFECCDCCFQFDSPFRDKNLRCLDLPQLAVPCLSKSRLASPRPVYPGRVLHRPVLLSH
jgi:hypothetical protein